MREVPTVEVWDPLVRISHWLLAASIAAAWWTRHAPGSWHEWIGYGSLALVAIRVAWGLIGSRYARFTEFVRSPANTFRYSGALIAGTEGRYLGHNPLGGWMVLTLLTAVVLVGVTGWLYTTERFWGIEWVERLHSALADALVVLIALHVAGVAFSSWRHRENLVASMLHGRKLR
jgi:cytochrome b